MWVAALLWAAAVVVVVIIVLWAPVAWGRAKLWWAVREGYGPPPGMYSMPRACEYRAHNTDVARQGRTASGLQLWNRNNPALRGGIVLSAN